MINIVIPMAGRGKRFVNAGYKKPKPFIDTLGKPMIVRVIENLKLEDEYRFIFICLKDFLNEYENLFKEYITPIIGDKFKIISIDQVTEGAACTVLLSKEYINNDDELVIANCDQLVLDKNFHQNSIDYYRRYKIDGGILCFINSSPKWSYVRLSGDRITEVVEKQVVSNLATVGIYYSRKGSYYVAAAENMIRNNIRVNGEFYCAPVYNGMIISGMKVTPFLTNEVIGLGIPEDLEYYIKNFS